MIILIHLTANITTTWNQIIAFIKLSYFQQFEDPMHTLIENKTKKTAESASKLKWLNDILNKSSTCSSSSEDESKKKKRKKKKSKKKKDKVVWVEKEVKSKKRKRKRKSSSSDSSDEEKPRKKSKKNKSKSKKHWKNRFFIQLK